MRSDNEKEAIGAWIVIAAGVAAALHVGKLSPALPALSAALGVTLLQAGFLLSLVQLAGMTLGLAVGLGADGLGLKRSVLIGLALLTLASALGGWARDAHTLLLLRAVEGLGFLLVSMPAPGLIRQLVPPQRLSPRSGMLGLSSAISIRRRARRLAWSLTTRPLTTSKVWSRASRSGSLGSRSSSYLDVAQRPWRASRRNTRAADM